jgi:hypothetical protein
MIQQTWPDSEGAADGDEPNSCVIRPRQTVLSERPPPSRSARQARRHERKGKLRFSATATELSNPAFYTSTNNLSSIHGPDRDGDLTIVRMRLYTKRR